MVRGRCIKCRRTILNESKKYCRYCWNEDAILGGGFKPRQKKFLRGWKEFIR